MADHLDLHELDGDGDESLLSDSFFPSNSRYIEVCELSDFFKFQGTSAINIMHLNCRSLRKNYCNVVNLLTSISKPITAIALSETWLTSLNEDTYSLPGYQFVSQTRDDKPGGGVGIFISNDFSFKLRTDLCRNLSCIECLFIEVPQKGKRNILFGCFYRPPNTDTVLFNTEIVEILKVIENRKNSIVFLAGDFNLDLLKFDNHAPTAEFLNNLLSYSYYPAIRYPTRISDTSATLIDNIFTNVGHFEISSAIIYCDISDHLPIALHFEISLNKKVRSDVTVKRIYDDQAMMHFHTELAKSENWQAVYSSLSVNDTAAAYDCFYDQYRVIFDKYFPEKIVKQSYRLTPRHEWMTKGLIRSCLKKSKLYKKYLKTGSVLDKNCYMIYRKKLGRLIKAAERRYYFDKLKSYSGDLRKTWKLLNSLTGKTQREDTIDSFVVDGVKIVSKEEIVERLNEYFVNIGSHLAASIKPASTGFRDYLGASYMHSFALYPTSSNEIVSIVSDFGNKRSAGYDDIPVNIMKSSIYFVAEPISDIVNSSLITGIFPDRLKMAKVCPVFKGGEKTVFQNYRPISVLPSFSKIFEKVVFNRLLSYIEGNNILCNNQYGFRKGHSTYMPLIDMYDKISVAIDKNEFPIGVFIDLSKAFDTLEHSILLSKLEHYGIRGLALNWFRSYLSNRRQCVALNGVISDFKNVTYGVPQGSILGPLLFILYINDIVKCSDSLSFILFADDTNLFFSCGDVEQLCKTVSTELTKLSDWFCANKLSLNAKKTNFILFGNKHLPEACKQLAVSIDGCLLEQVEHTKFLGVIVDAKLNWKKHVDYIALKISRGLGMMGRARNVLPLDSLLVLYQTMIYPYLTYCNLIWGSACASVLHKLACLQNRAIRLVTHASFRSSCDPLFARLNLLKLSDINRFQTAQFMYKVKNHLLPLSCMRYVTVADPVRSYYTRKVYYFNLVGFRTVVRENSVSVRGPKLWDSIPMEIQNAPNLGSFKHKLTSLFCHAYVNITVCL